MSIRITDANETSLKNLAEKKITSDDVTSGSGTLRVPTSMSLMDAIELCKHEKLTVVSVAPKRETLEELFVRVVGTARRKELSSASA